LKEYNIATQYSSKHKERYKICVDALRRDSGGSKRGA